MKALQGQKCCVCNKDAVERAFDDTAWCDIHIKEWVEFVHTRTHSIFQVPSDRMFDEWMQRKLSERKDLVDEIAALRSVLRETLMWVDRRYSEELYSKAQKLLAKE